MPFKITDRAAEQIKLSANDSGLSKPCLRIAAKKMADGGIDYAMGFDDPQETDSVYTEKGITLLIGQVSADYLNRCTLDYVEMDDGKLEFIFLNPDDPNYIPPDVEIC